MPKRKISVHLIVTSPSNTSGAAVFVTRFLKYAKLRGAKPFLRIVPRLGKKIPTLMEIKDSLPLGSYDRAS